MLGLVLTAGGARGAYQAGVLKRLGELPALRERPSPFLVRMNEIVGAGRGAAAGASEPIRIVEPLALGPSEDLALVAQRFAHRMPRLVRYLLEALGTPDAQSADLMSYLLFDAAYTRTLIEIGYEDASRSAAELEAFVREAAPPPALRPTRGAARLRASSDVATPAPH